MTSINAITDNRYAYMTADTAVYDFATGRVLAMTPKVLVIESLLMTIAFSGRWFGMEAVVEALDRHCPVTLKPTQAHILAAIVPALRELHERSVGDGLAAGFVGAAPAVTVALFDLEERRPRIFYAYADGCPNPATPEPFVLAEIPGIMSPPICAEREHEIWPAGYLKMPRRELRRLIELQRSVEVPHIMNGCGLGGMCQFYRIGPDGIWIDDLVRFPEGVGDMLDATLAGEPIPSRMDLPFAV